MVEDEGELVRSRNHSIFSSSAPGTSVKKWRINHCQFFLGGSFRPSQHVSPQDLMRNDLRITRRGNTTNRPSRRPFLTSVVMPICLRIGMGMGLGPVGCRWVPMGADGWDNLFCEPVPSGPCQGLPLHLLQCQLVPECTPEWQSEYNVAWTAALPLSLRTCLFCPSRHLLLPPSE